MMNPSSLSSVASLATACTIKFNELLSLENWDLHTPFENRAADFQLWVDGVGAVAKPGASLDSRFHDRPNDLVLIKGILIMLLEFLSELSIENSSSDAALINIDSALGNLAMIGVAIRRTGKASRSRRADQSFNPDYYEDLRRHLKCIILLRPTEDTLKCRGLDVNKVIGSENLDIIVPSLEEMASCRLGQLDGSNLTEIQHRLIDTNLRRRHRFILAQKRSQRNKAVHQTTHQTAHHDGTGLPEVEPRLRNSATSSGESQSGTKTQGLPKRKPQAPATITFMSTASTAEGTMKYDPKAKYVPTIAQSQISFIANETEFPSISLPLLDRHIIECPCCCQPLPNEEVRKPTNWRQHLIEDICPYSCVAEQCPTPELLFVTRKAWDTHVENDHPYQWKCVVCGQDGATFSNASDMTCHIQSCHQDELSSQSLANLTEWSRVQHMGIKSCPLCSDYGPEDSPELVDHVVRHAYEFSLRSLPWHDLPTEDLNRPIGTYSLLEDTRFQNWLEGVSVGVERNLELSSFDYADHANSMAQDPPQEDYFASRDYFDQVSADGSNKKLCDQRSTATHDQLQSVVNDNVSFASSVDGTQVISDNDIAFHFKASKLTKIERKMVALAHNLETSENMEELRISSAEDNGESSSSIKQGPWEPSQQHTFIDHRGPVDVWSTFLDVIHGLWGPSEPGVRATLLVLLFRVHPQKRARRMISADIELAFANSKGFQFKDPRVAGITFLGAWGPNTSKSTHEVHVSLEDSFAGTGIPIQPTVKWERGESRNLAHVTSIVGSVEQRGGWDNIAAWRLTENAGAKTGVPTEMRAGILLKRPVDEEHDDFICTVKVDAKFDLLTRLTRGFSGQYRPEPVHFRTSLPPTNRLRTYDTDNLGAFDLSLIEDIKIAH